MVAKITPDQFSDTVQEALDGYNETINQKVNQNLKDVADTTAETLQKGGSYNERTGKYTPDWTVTARKQASALSTEEYSVHNRKHYQLAHLLEKGHVTRNGGRTRSFVHILPAEQAAQELAVQAVEKAVTEANGGA